MVNFNNFRLYMDGDGNLVIAHLKHQYIGDEAGNGSDYVEDAKIVLGDGVFTIDGNDVLAEQADNVAAVDAETATAATNAAAINSILTALKAAGIMEADEPAEE